MIGRIEEIVIDCASPSTLAAFWAAVLGGTPIDEHPAWSFVDPPGWSRLAFQRVPEPKSVKNRVHLDVDVADLSTATAAAVALGATPVGDIVTEDGGAFQVMLDVEGNEWCLVSSDAGVATAPDEH
ncbi:MAG: VOC family protein [Acidimicrobiales bacterium]